MTPSPSITLTATLAPSATSSGRTYPPLAVMINEIAWAGTKASAHDEWIELHNPGGATISLEGWTLSDGADIHITLSGEISPYGFFLLERTDDSTVASIPADEIYTGSLRNSGEQLELRSPSGSLIDSANIDGGGWPAGGSATRYSMERMGGDDRAGNWSSFSGYGGNGLDASGQSIEGTPRQPNSIWFPAEPSPTTTPSPSVTVSELEGTPFPTGAILINEIAWAGTIASSSDEWIELLNTSDVAIALNGWLLVDGQDVSVALSGTIAPHSYFLLERTDDLAVADIPADQIFSGSLRNSGERLVLRDPSGSVVDTADGSAGWPAGSSASRKSMERRGGADRPGNWASFTGYHGHGHDAAGHPIQGTPRGLNSLHFPTPAPTWIPGKIVINEVLIRPHYDWQGTGGVDSDDEFIELYNLGPGPVNLSGWSLDDLGGAGSSPFELPGRTMQPGEFVSFFRSKTHIALNDTGDTVRLLDPSGDEVDSISYLRIRAANLSYGRLPDGSGHLFYGLWPTPRTSNLPFIEVLQSAVQNKPSPVCQTQHYQAIRVARLVRPALHQSTRVSAQVYCPAEAINRATISETALQHR